MKKVHRSCSSNNGALSISPQVSCCHASDSADGHQSPFVSWRAECRITAAPLLDIKL